MHTHAAAPAADGEPPAWTLPGELAHLAKPPSARPQTQRGGREPGAPERRRQSRPAPLGAAEPRVGMPAARPTAMTRPGALDAASRPPLPAAAVTATNEAPSERALRRALVACATGLVALMVIGWWLLNRTDVEVPSSAIVTPPNAPAAARSETIVRDELAVPMSSAPLPSAPLPPPERESDLAAEPPSAALPPPVAPVVTEPTASPAARVPATAPTARRKTAPIARQAAKPLSCSELLTRQSLGDSSVATPSALQRCR